MVTEKDAAADHLGGGCSSNLVAGLLTTTEADVYTRFVCRIIALGIVLTPVVAAAQKERATIIAGCAADILAWHQCALQKAKTFTPPRTPSGKPDFQGYWRPSPTAQIFNIEGVAADHPFVTGLPPGYAWSAGASLIVDPADRKVPYQPWAAKIGREGGVNEREYIDPRGGGAPDGGPRLSLNYPGSQILQPPRDGPALWLYETSHQPRAIAMASRPPVGPDVKTWNGLSRGRWEGNTLIIDTANVNGYIWLDHSGNFYTDTARVTERLTMVDRSTIHYQATIDDPTAYTHPWTMAWPLLRDTTGEVELLEESCREGDLDQSLALEQGLKHYYGAPWRSRAGAGQSPGR